MDKIRLKVCNACKKMTLNDVCNDCLNKIDIVEVDANILDIKLIEYSRSLINNAVFGMVEIRFDGMSMRVLGKINNVNVQSNSKLKISNVINNRFEFDII